MKKYCLTECFKRKMSRRWQNLLEVLIAIGWTIILVVGVSVVSAITGYIIFFLNDYFSWGMKIDFNDIVGIGFIFLLFSVLTIGVSIALWDKTKYIPRDLTNFIKDRYEGEPFECSIFEECKEEPEDK